MSGHSKWSTIKRKKGAADAKRGAIFTRISKDITLAVREGGGDPDMNPSLRLAVKNAKSANMPAANVERAINKGLGNIPGMKYENYIYEGYGPGGVAIMMDVMTDNKNRTVAEIRHIMSKHGGKLGENGSVGWMFEKSGQIILSDNGQDEDAVFEEALEAGAEDFIASDDEFIITASPADTVDVAETLGGKGYAVVSSAVEMVPKNTVKVEGNDVNRLITLMDYLEDHDDIQNIYSNFEIDDADL